MAGTSAPSTADEHTPADCDQISGRHALRGATADAVARTLERVERAAARGAYRVALGWLGTLQAIGDFPEEYRERQAAWRLASRAKKP